MMRKISKQKGWKDKAIEHLKDSSTSGKTLTLLLLKLRMRRRKWQGCGASNYSLFLCVAQKGRRRK
jgi:hypothetical protein